VSLLTEKLHEPDFESLLVCGTIDPGEGDMAYYASEHGVEPVIIPELGRSLHPMRDLKTLWKVYQLIREYKQPHVVHTHTAKAGFIGRLAAWLARVPVIIHTFHGHVFTGTFHGHVFTGYFPPLKTRFFIILEQFSALLADMIITLTEGLRRELAEVHHVTRRSRITVLPLGLDLQPFVAHPRKQGDFRRMWNIPADAPLIGIVGRIVVVKNHALFVEAAARIRQAIPKAHFVIVGDGDLRAEVEAQVEAQGLSDAVTFTGWQRNLEPIYADLDVVVISSINEGTPVSIIEALAAGCPVVGSGLPGGGDSGWRSAGLARSWQVGTVGAAWSCRGTRYCYC